MQPVLLSSDTVFLFIHINFLVIIFDITDDIIFTSILIIRIIAVLYSLGQLHGYIAVTDSQPHHIVTALLIRLDLIIILIHNVHFADRCANDTGGILCQHLWIDQTIDQILSRIAKRHNPPVAAFNGSFLSGIQINDLQPFSGIFITAVTHNKNAVSRCCTIAAVEVFVGHIHFAHIDIDGINGIFQQKIQCAVIIHISQFLQA